MGHGLAPWSQAGRGPTGPGTARSVDESCLCLGGTPMPSSAEGLRTLNATDPSEPRAADSRVALSQLPRAFRCRSMVSGSSACLPMGKQARQWEPPLCALGL